MTVSFPVGQTETMVKDLPVIMELLLFELACVLRERENFPLSIRVRENFSLSIRVQENCPLSICCCVYRVLGGCFVAIGLSLLRRER